LNRAAGNDQFGRNRKLALNAARPSGDMFAYALSWLDRKIGILVTTKSDGVLLRRRFAALQRQLPWLYAVLLANLLGLQITLTGEESVPRIPTLVMSAIIGFRALRWIRNAGENI
jgi:hypothetical protein